MFKQNPNSFKENPQKNEKKYTHFLLAKILN